MKLNKIIKKPIVTEKSINSEEKSVYHFVVTSGATKHSIAQAVESLFDVTVEKVRTMVIPGKQKRVLKTRRYTRTPKYKKAIVQIKEGQKIKLFDEGK